MEDVRAAGRVVSVGMTRRFSFARGPLVVASFQLAVRRHRPNRNQGWLLLQGAIPRLVQEASPVCSAMRKRAGPQAQMLATTNTLAADWRSGGHRCQRRRAGAWRDKAFPHESFTKLWNPAPQRPKKTPASRRGSVCCDELAAAKRPPSQFVRRIAASRRPRRHEPLPRRSSPAAAWAPRRSSRTPCGSRRDRR